MGAAGPPFSSPGRCQPFWSVLDRTEKECAFVIAFLAGDDASYVSGPTRVGNGGRVR
jgi:hypothetical protein